MNKDARTKSSGKLIVFEGADGVGKTTILKNVAQRLSEMGCEVQELSFPGKTKDTLGELVYNIHHNFESYFPGGMSPLSLQALHVAAHIDCIQRVILPALEVGKTIVLDRYWWSTIVYGLASGIRQDILDTLISLENAVWGAIRPFALFLVTSEKPFRSELTKQQWENVCNNYRQLAEKEKEKYKVVSIDNSATVESAVSSVINNTLTYLDATKFSCNVSKPTTMHDASDVFCCLPDVFISWSPSKTTEVFETYWKFATERQSIFYKRSEGKTYPWTQDEVLLNYKFTNAYRASDRVSQYLIRNVIYCGDYKESDILFRILLFKLFNRIGTWELLESKFGEISWDSFNLKQYANTLNRTMESGGKIYSAAYIMPSRGKGLSHSKKHMNHLNLIEMIMKDDLVYKITDANSMEEVFFLLRGYPMIGDFLAYQLAIDINYSTLTDFDEMSFVVPGPGAKDGLRKCFSDFGGLSEVDLIRMMADRQEEEFQRLGLDFQTLWGRKLQLIDCQNLLCEVDKYSRIVHPDVLGLSKRTRIKQKFRPTNKYINYFYPPKWGINKSIKCFHMSNCLYD